ncbi:N-acetylmuramoyl-L-alanine amidase [Enterococcus larvae]|uniref:N-acetylmuramoyl-L-alanine amidase n=1 Tax=Enterococcus larvae TaxID=2794352 RepID=UPI003F310BB8
MRSKKRRTKRVLFFLTIILGVGTASYFKFRTTISGTNAADEAVAEKESQKTLAIASTNETSETESLTTTVVQIGEEDIPLYSQPDADSTEITTVTRGEYVEFIDESYDWYHVVVNGEYEGYVSSLYSELLDIDEPVTPTSLENTVVVLNPGHGGDDTGALSNDYYYYEKDITLATAQVIQETLEAAGCTVILTRDSDTTESLDEICEDSIDNQADFFFSLHYDSTDYMNDASGMTTYYYYEKYAALAETINQALAYTSPLENRGVEVGNFQVLRQNTRPALLLELGYMNNDYDLATFVTEYYQQQVADALLEGITEYIQS